MEIKVLDGNYAVIQARKPITGAFANIQDKREITSVVKEDKVPKDAIKIEKIWKIIKFNSILDFSLVGFISKVSTVLAKENISIFLISSYSTDYVLVKKENLEKAKKILEDLRWKPYNWLTSKEQNI